MRAHLRAHARAGKYFARAAKTRAPFHARNLMPHCSLWECDRLPRGFPSTSTGSNSVDRTSRPGDFRIPRRYQGSTSARHHTHGRTRTPGPLYAYATYTRAHARMWPIDIIMRAYIYMHGHGRWRSFPIAGAKPRAPGALGPPPTITHHGGGGCLRRHTV